MFRSSFAKYLTAFFIIIVISFLLLSGIITSIIRNHVVEDKEGKLMLSCDLISDHFENLGITDFGNNINSGIAGYIITLLPVINVDFAFNILISDENGKVLLSTVSMNEDNPYPSTHGNLGNVNLLNFADYNSEGEDYKRFEGTLNNIYEDNVLCYGKAVVTDGTTRGYVFAFSSTANEERLISITRKAVFNSSIWVLLAAFIATYFITERIIHPLRGMTKAAKKFAKGDFTERVAVYGRDEVAELSIAFNNMAQSLESLEKMRNSFLANVSHDLRTPMTTISGFIDGITSGAIPPEKHGYYLGVISREVHRLSRLVTQLLDVSRLESGDRKFVFTEFDLAEMARIILISFEKSIDDKRLEVIFDAENDTMLTKADKDAIHQVVYNLCHNAIKFSNEGGRFEIKIKRDNTSKKLVFSIFDEGQQMSDEDAEHVFDRFYKTDKSRGLDKNGVGLGLYISKTIIEAHSEEILLKQHDGGCEFIFTLPDCNHN